MRFCLSVGIPDFERVKNEIRKYDLAEIRLDLCEFNSKEITELCASHHGLIFTFRNTKERKDADRLELLSIAIEKGAAFIDIDIGNQTDFKEQIKRKLDKNKTTKLIASFHDFRSTPTNQFLFEKILEMGKMAPDLKKLVCMSHGKRDNQRILAYNHSFRDMIAFAMGKEGEPTRIECLRMGAPFTYVAMDEQATAEGQMTKKEMLNRMEKLEQ